MTNCETVASAPDAMRSSPREAVAFGKLLSCLSVCLEHDGTQILENIL